MICAMTVCSNLFDRDDVRCYRLPKIVTYRGKQMLSLTTRQQLSSLKAISRDDITKKKLSHMFVSERHFLKLKPAYRMYKLDIAHLNTLGMKS